jgi:hypothetical protein
MFYAVFLREGRSDDTEDDYNTYDNHNTCNRFGTHNNGRGLVRTIFLFNMTGQRNL